MKFYNSIEDCPIYVWRKINETNDLRHLVIGNTPPTKRQMSKLVLAFEEMKNEFTDAFGISDTYKKIIEIKLQIRVWECRILLENEPSHINFIDVLELKLKKLLEEKNDSGFSKTKMHVSKFMGFPINEKDVSVKDFYTSYNELIEQNKQQSKAA